jgi:prepilin peptidase CpaA
MISMLILPSLKSLNWHHYYLIGLGLVCCFSDLRSGKIYNLITYPSILAGLLLNWLLSDKIAFTITGFLIGFVPFILATLKGRLGGGDAKLFGAVGAIGGFPFILHFLFITFLLASLYGLLSLIWRKGSLADIPKLLKKELSRSPKSASEESESPRIRIPMGVFSLLGILLALKRL